jgi:hypothetical protein
MQALTSPLVAASIAAQGIITWAFPLVVFLGVLFWYLLRLRDRFPE